MKKNENIPAAVCPLCGCTYREYPAISRTDNRTPICPDCGIRQALEGLGVSRAEQDHILDLIHSHTH